MSSDNDLEYKRIPRDEGILIIDKLLSSGWTSMLDMCIALNDYALKNGCQPSVARPVEDTLDFYVALMENRGIYSGDIRSSYFYHMVEIWSAVNEGDLGTPNEEKRDKYIDTIKKVTRKTISEYDVSEATRTYLFNAPHVRVIRLFKYKKQGSSIDKDLKTYNNIWAKRSSEKAEKAKKRNEDYAPNVSYDVKEAVRFSIIPEPEVIRRKVKLYEQIREHEALVRETTNAIQDRLNKIANLNTERPLGWIDEVTRLYLDSFYDGLGIIDSHNIKPIVDGLYSHLQDHLQVEDLPNNRLSVILDYHERCKTIGLESKFSIAVSNIANYLTKKELSLEDTADMMDYCVQAWGHYCYLEDDGFIKSDTERELGAAVWDLWISTSHVVTMLECTVSFAEYRLDPSSDLNNLVHFCYRVFADIDDPFNNPLNNPLVKCKKAEMVFVNQCKEFEEAIDSTELADKFAKDLVEMLRAFISQDISITRNELFQNVVRKHGIKLLNDEEKKHFNRMYQTFRFEQNWRRFLCLKGKEEDKDITHRNRSLLILIRHLSESLLVRDIELPDDSWTQKAILSELNQYELLLSNHLACPGSESVHILLEYAIIVISNKHYPCGIHEGGTVIACEKALKKGLKKAKKTNMNGDEYQLLLLLLAMIALHNTQDVPYAELVGETDDDMHFEYNMDMKNEMQKFFSLANYFVKQMKDSRTKRLLEKITQEQLYYGGLS